MEGCLSTRPGSQTATGWPVSRWWQVVRQHGHVFLYLKTLLEKNTTVVDYGKTPVLRG